MVNPSLQLELVMLAGSCVGLRLSFQAFQETEVAFSLLLSCPLLGEHRHVSPNPQPLDLEPYVLNPKPLTLNL